MLSLTANKNKRSPCSSFRKKIMLKTHLFQELWLY